MPTATLVLYGIKTCDTCRKARRWLDSQGLDHRYHDLRSDGIDAGRLGGWIERLGLEVVLNRRGTTWRTLAPGISGELNPAAARNLILSHPALLKRPIVECGDRMIVGFGPREREAILDAVGTRLAG